MTPNINLLSHLIEIESIKIISCDIFDTLIFRPVIEPKNIFFFLDEYYRETVGESSIEISKLRMDCENELIHKKGVENVTIDLIYGFLKKKTNLDKNIINCLKEKEISIEIDLSILNHEIYDILKKAKSHRKKIIFVTDMYLTKENITLLLKKHSIQFDDLYVSSDIKKRKDKGDLFDEILNNEKVEPYEILHIGDNENSDYLIPLKKGIASFLYKSNCFIKRKKIQNNYSKVTSIYLGYLINEENSLISHDRMKFTKLYDLGYFSLGPFVLAMMLHILFSKEIQNANTIYFSSRDGFLPFTIYEQLRKKLGLGIPGKYIYCGRRALNIAFYNGNPLEYIQNLYNKIKAINTIYTIEDVFSSLNLNDYYKNNNHCKSITNKISNFITDNESLSHELDKRKNNAIQYFNQLLDDSENEIIFDCGYSGSVSEFIYLLTNKRIDKIYIWETEENKYFDEKNKTKTNVLFNNFNEIQPFNLLFEELFSPLEAACVGYKNENGKMLPVFDNNETFTEKMKYDLEEVHNGVFDYTNNFCTFFNEYISSFSSLDYQKVFDYTMEHLFNERDESINLMENIVFYDKYLEGNIALTLLNKLIFKNRSNSFKGNILLNPKNLYIHEKKVTNNNIKIGIHIHLFYIDLYIDFLEKLIQFPYSFDLYITITNPIFEKTIYSYFSKKVITNLNKLSVIVSQNRGRDIAPWLIEMKNIHINYDIFGHFHTKKNIGIGFAEEWRYYFLDNLLNKNAVIDIMNMFITDKDIGIVYPPMFKNLYAIFTSVGDPPFQEYNIVKSYLIKIGLPEINNCNNILFSVGTMFWYRPIALQKLFYEKLSYNEFPEEPIGINGTLAHAIERLPSYVARIAGFDTKLYVAPKLLSELFYNQYYKADLKSVIEKPSSLSRLVSKKIYSKFLKIIPGEKNKIRINHFIRKTIYPKIKKYLR